jgi:hypothetical protein
MTHFETCSYIKIECPNGCEKQVSRGFLEEHNKVCQEMKRPCPDCETEVRVNDKKDHNCIEALMENCTKFEGEKKKVELEYGYNYDEVNPICGSGHKLKV